MNPTDKEISGVWVDEITVHDGYGNYLGRLTDLSIEELTSGKVQSVSVGFTAPSGSSIFTPLENESPYDVVAAVSVTPADPLFFFPMKIRDRLQQIADDGGEEANDARRFLSDNTIRWVRMLPEHSEPYRPGSSRSFDWSKFDVVPPREFHGRLFFDFPPEHPVPYSVIRAFARQAEASYYQICFLIGEVWAEQLAIAMENLSQRTRWSHPDLMRVAAETVLRVTRP